MEYVKISVIIPTYNDWNRLSLCLDALSKQTINKEQFDVYVVNNDLSGTVPEDFELPKGIRVRLLDEPKPGSYSARNRGIKLAKGEIVAFTDSDCIPDKNWLENAISYFQKTDVQRIGGRIQVFAHDASNPSPAELYDIALGFDQRRNIEVLKGSVTANFFALRNCFDAVGPFDAMQKSGEDFGWNHRANKFGYSLLYAADVLVAHPARRTIAELSKKKRRVVGGKVNFRSKNKKDLLVLLLYLPKSFVGQLIKPILRVGRKKELKFEEKVKVGFIVLYLFFVLVSEYFRLLLGGEVRR